MDGRASRRLAIVVMTGLLWFGLAACGDSRDASEREATIPRITSASTTSTSSTTEPSTTSTPTTTAPPATRPPPASSSPPPTNAPPPQEQGDNPTDEPSEPAATTGPTSTLVMTPGAAEQCSPDGIGTDTGHLLIADVVCHGGWATGQVDECPTNQTCEGADVFHVTDAGWVWDGYFSIQCAESLTESGMSIYTAMAFGPQPCDGDPGATQIIRPGSSGERVNHLQIALVSLGYGLAVDGTYGPRTQAAVRDFQARNGLEVDGIAGPRTQAALGIGPDGGSAQPAPSAPPASTSPGASTTVIVRAGEPVDCTKQAIRDDIGTKVDEINDCRAGWAIGLIERCHPNEICEHVDVFHITENGWVHDGTIDGLCAESLVDVGMSPHTAAAIGTFCADEPPARVNILPGSSGPQVRQVQMALVAVGYPIAVDGTYGPRTEAAVRDFQAAHSLEVDGIAGPNTQEALGM